MALPVNFDKIFEKSGRPELARHQWERLAPHLSPADLEAPGTPLLLSLLGNSQVLFQYLLQHLSEGRKDLLNTPKSAPEMEPEGSDPESVQRIIRRYKYDRLLSIAARDLSGAATFEETGREISDLAAACARAALRSAFKILGREPLPFSIIGMGKLGGGDLNFSSDVDLIYVHDTQGELPNELPSQVAELVTRILQERTADGFGFRVDLDLRPEGKSGVLVNSLEALVDYYEMSGAPWERSAWIKAHPVAGDAALGQAILREMAPFVFPKHTDASAITDLKAMKEKIHAALSKKGLTQGFNLKLGRGGIREIEFFVSAFQMVYGGKEPKLRERNTLRALQAAGDLGLVPAADVKGLRDAYVFLRRAENRLQMEEERQTHSLPKDEKDLLALSRRCGYSEASSFMEQLKKSTDHVSTCLERLAK